MPSFTGQLNSNEIFSALFNMIISQQVFADNIKGTFSSLVEKARVDGGLFGDTKLYYDTDVLKSEAWGNDSEASNLLALHRPSAPSVQAITLDVFRQISLTVDNYLSKRAWASEGAFASFNSVMLGWLRDTKRVYDATTYNTYIGTAKATIGEQDTELDLSVDASTGELDEAKLRGMRIAEGLANLFIELKDVSREYNDYGYLRSYDLSDLIVVWNSAYVNEIRSVDLPTIFHKEGLIEKFEDEVLPSRYFGTIQTSAHTTVADERSVSEADYTVGGVTTHCFAGDVVPTGASVSANATYKVDNKIICKVMHKSSVPYMSAFEVGTSFFNAKSLTENHYLTWGHNTLEYLKGKPFITVSEQ